MELDNRAKLLCATAVEVRLMTFHPFLIIAGMTVCSFAGGLSFRQYSETRDILWLVAGYSLYSLSNLLWILIIDQSGIAKAMVLASTAQIILTTAAGFYFGEKIGFYGIAAVVTACIAAGLTVLGAQPTAAPSPTSSEQANEVFDV